MKRTYVSRPILKHLLKQITGQAWTFQEFVEGGKRVVICHPVNPEQCRAFMDWLWERGLNRKWRSFTDAALAIMAAWSQHTRESAREPRAREGEQ